MVNVSIENTEENRAKAHLAFVRKRNKVATVITADDEINTIIWRFKECKDLWKNVETQHEDYISTLDQSNENLLQTQEAWFAEVQKIRHQKKKKQQTEEICHEQEKRDEKQLQLRQQQRRQDKVRNAYKVHKIEEAPFYSYG